MADDYSYKVKVHLAQVRKLYHKAEDHKVEDHKAKTRMAEDHKAKDHKVEDHKAEDRMAEDRMGGDHMGENHMAEDTEDFLLVVHQTNCSSYNPDCCNHMKFCRSY